MNSTRLVLTSVGLATIALAWPGTAYKAPISLASKRVASTDEQDALRVVENRKPRAALLVGSGRLSEGDGALMARLELRGFRVERMSADSLRPLPEALALVVVSASADGFDSISALRSLPIPIVALGAGSFPGLGLTGGTNGLEYGTDGEGTRLEFPLSVHPLAAGLQGPIELSERPTALTWGLPGKGAAVVGRVSGDAQRAALFAYETGLNLIEGRAPARRVALALPDPAAATLSRAGARVFDAAVMWASRRNAAPWVDGGKDEQVAVDKRLWLHGRVSDDGLPGTVPVTALWAQVSGPGVATFDDDTFMATSVTFDAPGSYVLRLTGSDGRLQASDLIRVNVVPSQGASAPERTLSPEVVGDVLLVVGDALNPTAGDSAIKSRILAMPSPAPTVELKTASSTVADDAIGRRFVFLASSSPNADLADKFKTVDVPVVVANTGIYDDMALTDADKRGNAAGTQLLIAAPSHPLVAGVVSSPVTTNTGAGSPSFAWGSPASGGTLVASLTTDATKGPIFAYETGAAMAGGFLAPAKRIGFGLETSTLTVLPTGQGQQLLDNLIGWLLGANLPPSVYAGPDQIVNLSDVVTLDGTVTDPSAGSGLHSEWSVQSGPGLVNFTDPSAVDTTATFSAAGSYVLRLTATDGEFIVFDEASILVKAGANVLPLVYAGADRTIVAPVTINLSGTVMDDGLPIPPGITTSAWTKQLGPATVTFGNSASPTSTATFPQMGTYVLRLTANDSTGAVYDEMLVNAKGKALLVVANKLATTNADEYLQSRLEAQGLAVTMLNASEATGSSANGFVLVVLAWSCPQPLNVFASVAVPALVENPGLFADMSMTTAAGLTTVSNGTVNALPTASPLAAGLSGSVPLLRQAGGVGWGTPTGAGVKVILPSPEPGPGGPGTHATVFTSPGPARRVGFSIPLEAASATPEAQALLDAAIRWAVALNLPPAVDAGPNRTVAIGSPATLDGTVSDQDGLPTPPSLSYAWTQVSGPGAAGIASPSAVDTTATFATAGIYYLRLTASDGELAASDLMSVTVTPLNPADNAAPSVSAGPDRTLRLPATLSLSASIFDDGKPSPPATVTKSWTVVNSPPGGSASFDAPTSAATNVTFTLDGVYTLRISASDTVLSSSDEIQVTVSPVATALMVFDGPTGSQPASPEDLATKARLESLGFSVATIPDAALSANGGQAVGKDLVVATPFVGESVGTKLSARPEPVLSMEWNTFHNLGFTAFGASGVSTSDLNLTIANAMHPMAAGLTGTRTALTVTGSNQMTWGVPGPNALKIASLVSDASRFGVFGYEKGAAMPGQVTVAPGRRVAFFAGPFSATADGKALFDAAVLWAAAKTVPALLVTGSASLTVGEIALRDRMVALGLAPVVVTSTAVVSGDADGKALVVVTSSANLSNKLLSVPQASFTVVDGAFPGMGLTGPTPGVDFGTQASQTQIEIQVRTHPLALDLVGIQTVTSSAQTYAWGRPGAGGVRVAGVVQDTTKGPILAYDIGAALPTGGTTTDRRVGYFLSLNGANALTTVGGQLVDKALTWLVSSDVDADGLSTFDEFRYGTNPFDPDTNDDGLRDGAAVRAGLSPTNLDMDGDGVPNVTELANRTDPFRWDTDGDGVSDLNDVFPLDPTRSSLPAPTPGDTTPPTITLLEPTNATEVP